MQVEAVYKITVGVGAVATYAAVAFGGNAHQQRAIQVGLVPQPVFGGIGAIGLFPHGGIETGGAVAYYIL